MKNKKFLFIGIASFAAAAILMFLLQPSVESRQYESDICDLSQVDSLLVEGVWEGRQAGWVNLDMFRALCDELGVECKKSSGKITCTTDNSNYFYGTDDYLLDKKHLCIEIGEDECSFDAETKKIDGVAYVFIPYHILVSMVGFCDDSRLPDLGKSED